MLLPSRLRRATSLPEGGFYSAVYISTNTFKITIDLVIGESYDLQIVAFENFGSKFIVSLSFCSVVLCTVYFNHKLCFVAIKICYKNVYYFLPLKPNFIF